MRTQPSPTGNSGLITKKQFWTEAYLAALHRVPPTEALAEADEALRLCDNRWRDPPYIAHWKYNHDFPLGHTFPGLEE
jgi:hypothetical protein